MNENEIIKCEFCENEIKKESFSTVKYKVLCDSCYYGNTWQNPVY